MPCLAPSLAPAPPFAASPMVDGRARHGARHSVPQVRRLMVVGGWAPDRGVGGPPCRVWHRAWHRAHRLLPSSWWMDEPGTKPDTPWSQVGLLMVVAGW